jgi:AraC-like DNA-binding protein
LTSTPAKLIGDTAYGSAEMLNWLVHEQGIEPPTHRGGLPPGAMRRVHDHVDAHLSNSIDLAELSAVAGLSVFHFARQFKLSMGVTPHHYLVRRRVQRAQEMLVSTDLSLSDIAIAAGFSDQSHLARHFRQMVGMTPGQFRRSHR